MELDGVGPPRLRSLTLDFEMDGDGIVAHRGSECDRVGAQYLSVQAIASQQCLSVIVYPLAQEAPA